MPITLNDCKQLDNNDPLRIMKDYFTLPEGIVYLDGNSLGAMPKSAASRIGTAVEKEWGNGLIRSWNDASWHNLPERLGDKIARLIGAASGEVVVTDGTSVNLFKVLSAALNITREDSPKRKIILSERSNFPTNLYIAEGLCKQFGLQLKLVEPDEIISSLTEDIAIVLITQVNYRLGILHNMEAVNVKAHAAGIITIWDLCHSAGAVPIDLNHAKADFAVGCTYKYLNGGPGSPSFVWVNKKHINRGWQPLSGWWGHKAQFKFTPNYIPAIGIKRYLCGTQPILSLIGLECGLDAMLASEKLGGIQALRKKSLALTDLFIQLIEQRCSGYGITIATPMEHSRRGSQISLARKDGAYAIVQALIARGVIGDFRAGDGNKYQDIMRFGFTPLYVGFEDVWNSVEHLYQVLINNEWSRPEFNKKNSVT